ncbi:hypothetical protein LJR220_001658 [Bradyrhizobium sp. LjRoot220]|uniref:lipase/acyltransferase domain-containing protein n=1 Tax=Bradyrhizobium sp. LjRoot220 TaxID=3342284 RepID=UPI003ED1063A
MARRWLLGIGLLAIGSTTPANAQIVPANEQGGRYLAASVPEPVRVDFYAEQRAAKRKNAPRIVFVPGILGSKIDECRTDGSQCKNIWGTAGAVGQRDLDLSIRSDRKYRTDVVDNIFFNDIYGTTLDFIREQAFPLVADEANDPLLTIFHYDWRQSNGDNAKLLKDRVCTVRANAKTSPIIIIAHSMGGLVTKVWTARHANENCPDGVKPDVTQIVFVATPHLGSPKAIKAIAEGYNILFDELTGLKRYLGIFERNYLLDAVNQAGISFPSIYEMMPIRSSEYCNKKKPALLKAAVPVVDDDGNPLNLFDVDTWRRYDLLRRIGSAPVRKSYYDNELAPMLHRSEQLLCEIADFDPSQTTNVVYLFGRQNAPGTYGRFQFRIKTAGIFSSSVVQGDGTVPMYSAQNFLVSSTSQTEEVEADHTSIVKSEPLRKFIRALYGKAVKSAAVQIAGANEQYASLLVAEAVGTGNLIPVSLDPKAWSQGDEEVAIKINTRALDALGYKTAAVADQAARTTNAAERMRLYAVAASSTKEVSERLPLVAELARSAYGAGQFKDAIGTATFITTTAESAIPATDPKREVLLKVAREVEGWGYLRSGELGKFNEVASSYATKYKVRNSDFKEPLFATTRRDEETAWSFDEFRPVIKLLQR